MADITREIRAILEGHLSTIVDVPQIAYESVSFAPTTGTSYLQVVYLPVTRRPAVRGLNPQQRYDSLLSINCYAPEGSGPSAADTLAKNVMEAFEATTSISQNNITVRIDYAERQQGILNSPWYFVPVNIACYAYN
tara:strand:+ start:299 stop:706 length:408 start_codon:yes stop_codon:yes gene_type:complete